jgi:hypothetical protein
MKALPYLALAFAFSLSAAYAEDQFDGTKPLKCTAEKGHDCMPKSCSPLKPESGKNPVYDIDFANKEVRSPFRTDVMKVAHTTTNEQSLVLQGAALEFAWSALINKTTGALTVAVADRKGAYIAFGTCKVAE